MRTYHPPHEARDTEKLNKLVEAFRIGEKITPIVVQGDMAFTGSHRIAAHLLASKLWHDEAEGWEESKEPELEVVEIDCETWQRACQMRDVDHLDELGDWNDLCDALYSATDDCDIKAALEDQRE